MDPYIEQPRLWSDFHADLAAEMRAALNRVIQPRYVAAIAPYVTYEIVEIAEVRAIRPDVGVLGTLPARGGGAGVLTPAPAPVTSTVPFELPIELSGVEIHATENEVLVCAIEILSPVNKRPGQPAWRDYRRKRASLLRSGAHFMEIDLLRGGERPPLGEPVPTAPYYVTLSRYERRPTVEVWPIQISDPLPIVPVPLLEPDPDVSIDLGELVRAVYERGGFASRIDYRSIPPPPQLATGEAAWIEERLRSR